MEKFHPCNCIKCQEVQLVRNNNVWMHLPNINNNIWANFTIGWHENVFDVNFDYPSENINQNKPNKCIWFSRGSFLYDPSGNNCDSKEKDYYRVFLINQIQTKDILVINTWNQLELFVNKFYNSHLHKPDWNLVAKMYKGVAFDFKNISELVGSPPYIKYNKKYSWHLNFKVESLCIFNIE